MSRVFLTGATGNVGRVVLTELIARGHEVVALMRSGLPGLVGYRPLIGDLARIDACAAEIAACEAIIHCASPRSQDRATVLAQDIEATGRLVDAWTGGPFLYTSSQTVYGIPRDVLTEASPSAPHGWYDLGKVCNEHQVTMAAGRDGRGAGISLRLPLVFATGPRRRDRQFLPDLFDAVLAGRPFLFADAAALETCGSVFMGEHDLARAIVDALVLARSGPYNLAGGFCTWKELLETMGRHAGREPSFRLRAGAVARDGEWRMPQSRSFYDCTRFDAATGFKPQQTLDEIVGRFVAAERR
jgi:nucleoside-diphosphate-sugar epimerase